MSSSAGRGPSYKYFGAAKNLPGVKELFEKPKPAKKARRTKHEILRSIDADYFGYRDEDDGVLLMAEEEADAAAKAAALEEAELALEAGHGGPLGASQGQKLGAEDGAAADDGGGGGGGGFVAFVPLPDEKEIEKKVLDKKKADLLAKYASKELQESVVYKK